MNTFTNWAHFADWFFRTAITLVAIVGLLDRMIKRVFHKYFTDAVQPVTVKLMSIEEKIDTIENDFLKHNHEPPIAEESRPRKWVFFR